MKRRTKSGEKVKRGSETYGDKYIPTPDEMPTMLKE